METTPLIIRPKNKTLWSRLPFLTFRKKEPSSREIFIGQLPEDDYPPNYVCNQKYNIFTFLPLVLFEQFRFFLNLYFLVMALSQFIPGIRIGYLYTYWEDYRSYAIERVPASELRVGDIVMLHKGQRVPADMILLRTNETMGTVFIRTDQLDGEIDWKLRIPLASTQKLPTDAHLLDINAQIFVEKPVKDIHSFVGTCFQLDKEENDPVMNNAIARSKAGRLDLQINNLTKLLFVATMFLSLLLITLKGFTGPWYGFLFRFVLLFSYIIPISLRVNLDIGKVFYSWTIQRDKEIEGTVMRSTTIPEELGRIQYLLADKTGTLTKNEMVESLLTQYITNDAPSLPTSPTTSTHEMSSASPRQVWQAVLALALCHNVTPVYE
ncbi:putative cation-transporting atpase, partial [Operophtera brumata]